MIEYDNNKFGGSLCFTRKKKRFKFKQEQIVVCTPMRLFTKILALLLGAISRESTSCHFNSTKTVLSEANSTFSMVQSSRCLHFSIVNSQNYEHNEVTILSCVFFSVCFASSLYLCLAANYVRNISN